jgi:hypothetical protein
MESRLLARDECGDFLKLTGLDKYFILNNFVALRLEHTLLLKLRS